MKVNELLSKYKVQDSRDWKIERAKRDIVQNYNKDYYTKILYRPFDVRETFYTGKNSGFIGVPQKKVANMLNNKRDNISLIIPRFVENTFNYCSISHLVAEYHTGYVAPLYLYNEGEIKFQEREENFTTTFRNYVNEKYGSVYNPEEILGYIYGVLYCPTYREKYAEFLTIDFPRIPFVDSKKLFEQVSSLGSMLIKAHLMKDKSYLQTRYSDIGNYLGKGNHSVEKPEYKDEKIYINPDQYFGNVSEKVYDFLIGDYKVLNKYLTYRKGRTLNLDEISTVEHIIKVLAYTIEKMKEIDNVAGKKV